MSAISFNITPHSTAVLAHRLSQKNQLVLLLTAVAAPALLSGLLLRFAISLLLSSYLSTAHVQFYSHMRKEQSRPISLLPTVYVELPQARSTA